MNTTLIIISAVFAAINFVVVLILLAKMGKDNSTSIVDEIKKLFHLQENSSKRVNEEFRANRKEINSANKENRDELTKNLRLFTDDSGKRLEGIKTSVETKLETINEKSKKEGDQMRKTITEMLRNMQTSFGENVKSFNDLQREKFGELSSATEKKLEQMRLTVDEKLQKTLENRLTQSFKLVQDQLENVQKGLGEMQNLAQDVGGLKKVLSNVKMRGGFGEVQLSMLLDNILAPGQYEANVATKPGSRELVEFAVKLPGRDNHDEVVYLPIDAKFPRDSYEKVVDAHEEGNPESIQIANKQLVAAVKKMAGDIRDKYISVPHTTDFGIMFLPFEGIYAEVVRDAALLEQLQRDYKVVVTGPTTLAAILNSLQMGFRTLAIQQRSSEVWETLGAVKTEFGKFHGMLQKAHKNIQMASGQIETVMGQRTRAINRKLKDVVALPEVDTVKVLGIEEEIDD